MVGWCWLVVDVSPRLRPDANTFADRAFCHTFGRGEGMHQMVPGWPHSVVAAVGVREAQADDREQEDDRQLERAVSAPLEGEDREARHGGDQRGGQLGDGGRAGRGRWQHPRTPRGRWP